MASTSPSSLPAVTEAATLVAAAALLAVSVHGHSVEDLPNHCRRTSYVVLSSACVAAFAVWTKKRSRMRTVPPHPPPEPRTGDARQRDSDEDGGGDPEGMAMGSVLTPLLLSAAACVSSLVRRESDSQVRLIHVYARVAAASGLAFSIASLASTEQRRELPSKGGGRVPSTIRSLGGSVESATAILFLLIMCLWTAVDVLSSLVDGNTKGELDSLSISASFLACAVQCLSIAWFAAPKLQTRSGATKLSKNEEKARKVSQAGFLEDGSKSWNGVTKAPELFGTCNSQCCLEDVFTRGEWMAVSSVHTVICVDFILRYCWSPNHALPPMPPYLAVSHGGTIGCLVGCMISSFINSNQSWLINWQAPGKMGWKEKWLLCSAKLFLVVASTVGFVETAVACSCAHHEHLCPSTVGTSGLLKIIPRSLTWLRTFLSTPELCQSSFSWMAGLATQPKWVWLVYWSVVLAFLAPFSMFFATKLKQMQDAGKKQRYTVVARKFFHFVALVLFLPPTYLSPAMMTLSYAVASALLVLVEHLRVTTASLDAASATRKRTKPSLPHTRYTINDFFEAFYDEKDVCGKRGGFVVTHAALVYGCAIPLWVKEIIFQPLCFSSSPEIESLGGFIRQAAPLRLLPLVGVLVLGVGDAAGALVGIFFGRTRWPGSRRTVEGSVAMVLSMFSCCVALGLDLWNFGTDNTGGASVLLCVLTILEASTSQIDNICLPVAGATFILIQLVND